MLFEYQVKLKNEIKKGELEATSATEAAKVLSETGGLVLEINPKRGAFLAGRFRRRITLKDKILFTKQLAVMIKAGLPLDEALQVLSDQIPSKTMGQAILTIARDVKGGVPLSQSMSKHPHIFPQVYVNLIKSGERSGKLDEVLFRLAEQQEKDYDLISKVRGAMIYPAVIFTALIAVVILILVFVMPQIEKIFADLDTSLPFTTRFLLYTSAFLRRWIIVVVVLAVGVFFGLRIWVKRSPQMKERIDRWKLKIPVFGPLTQKVALARFTRTTSTLITAGLPMLEILDTTADVMGNLVYMTAVKRARSQVETGVALSQALAHEKVMPKIISQVVAIGEKSGNLDYALTNIADFYDREVDATTRNLSSILEPILMIVIGLGVGFVVISVIAPIYNLVEVV